MQCQLHRQRFNAHGRNALMHSLDPHGYFVEGWRARLARLLFSRLRKSTADNISQAFGADHEHAAHEAIGTTAYALVRVG